MTPLRRLLGSLVVAAASVAAGCSDPGAPSEPAVAAERPAASATAPAPLVTEIHSVADIVASMSDAKATADRPGADAAAGSAARAEELAETIRTLGAQDRWPDHDTAAVNVQGDVLVVRATSAYQQHLAAWLDGLRGR